MYARTRSEYVGRDQPPIFHRVHDQVPGVARCSLSIVLDMGSARDAVPADARYCRHCQSRDYYQSNLIKSVRET